MNLDLLFAVSSSLAVFGWLALVASLLTKRPFLRSYVARLGVPLVLSVLYAALIVVHWGNGEGGFDTLDGVALLFESRGILLAGWIHYLAFDLLVGVHLAERSERDGVPRLVMLPIFAATLFFGPMGYLAYHLLRPLVARRDVAAAA
jgi:hypothetical protein